MRPHAPWLDDRFMLPPSAHEVQSRLRQKIASLVSLAMEQSIELNEVREALRRERAQSEKKEAEWEATLMCLHDAVTLPRLRNQ